MFQRIKKEEKSIVLTGYLGSGKTSFFNKICNSNQVTKQGGKSVTEDVFSKRSAHGQGFNVLDTPGFGVKSKKIEHACAVMCALSEGPINQIFIVVKFERTDVMIEMYLKRMITGLYNRFRNFITVVVTHWDLMLDGEKSTQDYIQKTKEEITLEVSKLQVNSILYFSNKYDSGKEVCQKIDFILKNSQSQNLEISEAEFYSNFDLLQITDEIEQDLDKAKEKVTVQFRRKTKVIKDWIKAQDENNVVMPEMMHELTVAIKEYANQEIENFEKRNSELFSQLYDSFDDIDMAYVLDIELKKELMKEVKAVIDLAQSKIKLAQDHCYNFIKKCPYCGLIWIKVAGCDGTTTCGNFPVTDDVFKHKGAPKRFKFEFTDKQVLFTDSGEQQSSLQAKSYADPGEAKRIGCKKPITWSEIPPLPANLIKELLDPGVMDFLVKEVERKESEASVRYDIKNQVKDVMRKTKIIVL